MEELKLFYTIAEVSKLTGIKPYILRYWESEFKQLQPEREKGRRRYRGQDIEVVNCIKRLLYKDGFTIAGAKSKLRKEMRSGPEAEEDKESIEKLKKQLQDLLKIVKREKKD